MHFEEQLAQIDSQDLLKKIQEYCFQCTGLIKNNLLSTDQTLSLLTNLEAEIHRVYLKEKQKRDAQAQSSEQVFPGYRGKSNPYYNDGAAAASAASFVTLCEWCYGPRYNGFCPSCRKYFF